MSKIQAPAGYEAICEMCGDPCDGFAGNPSMWPVALPVGGAMKYHHSGCVALTLAMRLQDIEDLRAALRPFADEPLSTEPGHNRTRLFSFEDLDEKIRRARAAIAKAEGR